MTIGLRDYLMAHAPVEPQPWFLPVMRRARPLEADAEALGAYFAEVRKQLLVQWPAAWADAVMNAASHS